MGVMSCVRNGCDNIMCDTYIDGIGYVCYDCQKEFKKEYGDDSEYSFNQIHYALERFVNTKKRDVKNGNGTISDFFNAYRNE
jgi:hypothetical protein